MSSALADEFFTTGPPGSAETLIFNPELEIMLEFQILGRAKGRVFLGKGAFTTFNDSHKAAVINKMPHATHLHLHLHPQPHMDCGPSPLSQKAWHS